jgi:hypothetical protein
MWDLWWTKWHWDRFSPEYFGFPMSMPLLGNGQKIIIFIFIIGLHNKPQGSGASAAFAAGPFTTKKKGTDPP